MKEKLKKAYEVGSAIDSCASFAVTFPEAPVNPVKFAWNGTQCLVDAGGKLKRKTNSLNHPTSEDKSAQPTVGQIQNGEESFTDWMENNKHRVEFEEAEPAHNPTIQQKPQSDISRTSEGINEQMREELPDDALLDVEGRTIGKKERREIS